MHSTTADTPKITIDEYPRMQSGGWWAVALGSLGAAVLLTVGITTHVVLPTGFASLTMGAYLSGCILLVGRLLLRGQDQTRMELEDHKADHQVAQIDTQDIASIKSDVAKILVFMARMEQEDRDVRELVRQVEEFTAWRARVTQQLAALTDPDVINLDTVRELNQLSERRRDKDQ